MKLLLIILLATLTLASTDVLPPHEAHNEFVYIATSDYQCNLYIELTGQNLEALTIAEANHNAAQLRVAFNAFMQNSAKAIDVCSYIDAQTTSDITDIQNGISYYYYKHYK